MITIDKTSCASSIPYQSHLLYFHPYRFPYGSLSITNINKSNQHEQHELIRQARYNDYWMKNCEVLQLELPEPLLPMAERVPSLPAAALADTEEKVPRWATTCQIHEDSMRIP